MKRNDMDIDEILKHYLPRASQEEVDEASETVLNRIRSMRFQGANAQKQGEAPEDMAKTEALAKRLLDFHIAILMAVEQLQGQGRPVTITLKVEEVLDAPIVSGSAVFLILLMMERMGLVSSSPIDPKKPEALDKHYYEITPLGKRVLARAAAIREGVRNPLEDFA